MESGHVLPFGFYYFFQKGQIGDSVKTSLGALFVTWLKVRTALRYRLDVIHYAYA